jgi:hypothetical protein
VGWLTAAVGAYILSAWVVFSGVLIAQNNFISDQSHYRPPEQQTQSFLQFQDGNWYYEIITLGYSYSPGRRSNIAFFPLYPLVAGGLARATGLPVLTSLALVSNAALVAAYALFVAYARRRTDDPQVIGGALAAFALFPPTFFFRMAYAESLFLVCGIGVLLVIQRRGPILAAALLTAAAGATRSVGLAFALPVAMYAWEECRARGASRLAAAWRTLAALAMSGAGLAAFMLYQLVALGDPLAFVRVQEAWVYAPPVSLLGRLWASFTLWPIWGVYDPQSPTYWQNISRSADPVFNLPFANPLYFLLIVALVGVGWRRKWLDRYDLAASAGLLAIPYFTRGYDIGMNSHARYAAVAFPAYLVAGHLFPQMPAGWGGALLGVCGWFPGMYAALYSIGYPLF